MPESPGAATRIEKPWQPRVSIVTPNLDHGAFLRQCVDSVLGQGYPDLEYLVLDGGSRDESIEVLKSYGDGLSWVSGRDGGQAAAINEGFRKATGDVIAWLNSDDYYLPGAVRAAVDALAAAPDALAVHGTAWMVDRDGRRLRRYPSFDLERRHLRRKCYVCQPTVFLRRSVLETHGFLNEELDVCFDYEWWLRITRGGRMAFCDRPLAATRQHARTKTRARRSRGLIEAGYLMQHHFGRVPWRWAAKWTVHRWAMRGRPFPLRPAALGAALRSARAYRRRFAASAQPGSRRSRLRASLGGGGAAATSSRP